MLALAAPSVQQLNYAQLMYEVELKRLKVRHTNGVLLSFYPLVTTTNLLT